MFGAKKRKAIWAQVAKDLGGDYHAQSKWYRGDEHISAQIQEAAVKLDVYVVSTGKSTQVFTRIAAPFVYGPGFKMKVYKEGFFSKVGKALGMDDIELGDAAFDKRFVVRTAAVGPARRLWSQFALDGMDALADTWISSDATQVGCVGTGRWNDPVKMKAAFALIGELASRDIYGANTLHAVGAFSQPEGERPRATLDTGVRVVVQAEDRGDKLVMGARVVESLPLEPLLAQIVDGKLADQIVLPQAAHPPMHAAGSGELTVNPAWMSFVWNDLELDPARLRAGAELLGAIAIASRGVYR